MRKAVEGALDEWEDLAYYGWCHSLGRGDLATETGRETIALFKNENWRSAPKNPNKVRQARRSWDLETGKLQDKLAS